MQRRFHTTDHAEAILRDGFRNSTGFYGFGGPEVTGVFVSLWPVDSNQGAKGHQVLEITFPDDLDLESYAVDEEGQDIWEWLMPAAVINERGTVRLVPPDEELEDS